MNENQQNPSSALLSLENLRTRLLDLTARNRLLNYRHGQKGNLRIIDELPDYLHELLLSEEELRFLSVPEPKREQLIEAGYIKVDEEEKQDVQIKKYPTAEEWARWLGFRVSYELPGSEEIDS